jgi:hypothetical protein
MLTIAGTEVKTVEDCSCKKFSLAKTLTNIRNSSNATTDSSNAQLLNSLLKTFNVDLKTVQD